MANGQPKALPMRSAEVLYPGMGDGQLLAQFHGGRDELAERSFSALVHRHGPMVLRVCQQILGDSHRAEDAFQATFLVLARRSGTIRQPDLLANWLYGVALRTAWEARMRDGRRRRREAPTPDVAEGEPVADATPPESALIRREEFEALHEEVARLPERYRIPVVLCELEGLSYQEVALRMRCPVSTVGVRLRRARQRLRVRLVRRGILPAAAVMNALFGEGAAASVPSLLADATVRAALGFAAGDAVATGLVSGSAVAIAQAVLKAMNLVRLKVVVGTALLVGVTATVGTVSALRGTAPPAPVARSQPQPQGVAPVVALASFSPAPAAPRAVPVTAAPVPEEPAEEAPAANAKPQARVALASVRKPVRDELARGEMLFAKEWSPNDPMSPNGDGLGPVYNETSCVACHGLGAPGGGGPDSKNVVIVSARPAGGRRVPKGLDRFHPAFREARSIVLHRFGTDPTYALWRRRFYESHRGQAAEPPKEDEKESVEARMQRLVAQTAGARLTHDRVPELTPAPGVVLRVSERNTPALFGAGRIDAVRSEVMDEEAARQPADVRGRVSRDRNGRVGRFGWKGQVGTLHDFVRSACAGELGLEVPGHSQPASPIAPGAKAKGLDMTEAECDALVAYVRALPAPLAIDPTGPQGTRDMAAGRELFAEVGCATCHAPSLGDVRGLYSDLLLHNMGPTLSDSGVYYGFDDPDSPGGASPGEWRTPPLWGFRDSAPYMHDGRAQTLEEAVVLHGGQGGKSAKAFFALSLEEQSQIEAFLKSLVAPATTATSGLVLAAELEARIEPDEVRRTEAFVRQQRAEAAARDEQQQREARERQRAAEAATRASRQLPIAENLTKMGKTDGALKFYREIAREVPDTADGRLARKRIAELLRGERSTDR